MIGKEIEIEVLRLYHVEKWRIHAISQELKIHHATIRRVLAQSGQEKIPNKRPRMVDPYMSFIHEQLEKYPNITGSRLFEMVKQRGYAGQASHFRTIISELRPRRQKREAFLRLRTLPGEEAQVDWGHFGSIEIDNTTRPLMAFVITLSYSRATYLQFFPSQSTSHFLAGHVQAFAWFQGIPKICKYDNLKSVVIERAGKAIRFNSRFLEFAGAYRFEPRPVGVARGNEKGRVERAIRYIRTSFFAGRRYKDLKDLNKQALQWCKTTSLERRWVENKLKTVREVFEEEKALLIPLPEQSVTCEEHVEVTAGKTPYIRFDLNDYSIPYHFVGETLIVRASPEQVRIYHGMQEVASHSRSYGRAALVQDEKHILELKNYKQSARTHSDTHYLLNLTPSAENIFASLALSGEPLRSAVRDFISLLELYGPAALENAMQQAVIKNSPHPNSVRHILETEREKQNKAPLRTLPLDDPRIKAMTSKPHSLNTYESLTNKGEYNNDRERTA